MQLGSANFLDGVDNQHNLIVSCSPKCYPSIFVVAVFCIKDRHRQSITKHRGSQSKRYAMLGKVGARLALIPSKIK